MGPDLIGPIIIRDQTDLQIENPHSVNIKLTGHCHEPLIKVDSRHEYISLSIFKKMVDKSLRLLWQAGTRTHFFMRYNTPKFNDTRKGDPPTAIRYENFF